MNADPDFDYFLAGHGTPRAEFDELIERAAGAFRLQWEEELRRNRLYWSGPGKMERQIGRAYRIKPKLLGVGPPPLAIDGHEYRRRQRNRVKRRRQR